jgi:hypothetical protein
LPNFFIIGAAKAGTTSLYEYIKNHPEIYLSNVKEPHYFCNDALYEKGLDYYVDTYFSGAERYPARGEATPHYLYYEKAARRMAEALPRTHQKFIVVLRNPVQRAYSLYWNMVAEGHESLSFEDAVAAESSRLNDASTHHFGRVRHQYVDSGMYARQIRTYFKYFDPSQFLILFLEDLVDNHDEVIRGVYRFIGVSDRVEIESPKTCNASGMPRYRALHRFLRHPNRMKRALGRVVPFTVKYRVAELLLSLNKKQVKYPPMKPEMQDLLQKRFSEDIKDLEKIVGRPILHW